MTDESKKHQVHQETIETLFQFPKDLEHQTSNIKKCRISLTKMPCKIFNYTIPGKVFGRKKKTYLKHQTSRGMTGCLGIVLALAANCQPVDFPTRENCSPALASEFLRHQWQWPCCTAGSLMHCWVSLAPNFAHGSDDPWYIQIHAINIYIYSIHVYVINKHIYI